MKKSASADERIAKMIFANIYPLYVNKVEKKGRTESELQEVIMWLTGLDQEQLQAAIADDSLTIQSFFEQATIHPNASLIKGVVCGYRVEEIENTLTQKARFLDKLVDELSKGKAMDKILRNA